MAIEKIGINWSALRNITTPQFDFKNTTQEFLDDVPNKANQITEGFLGLIVLSGLFFWLFWKLSQQDIYGGDFSLSNLRAMGVSSAVCSIMGLVMVNMGYFTNYYHVVIFIFMAFLMTVMVWKAEK